MAKTIMAVFTNPASAEAEDEYNRWYDEVHVKELLTVPGVLSASRYRLSDGGHGETSDHRYLAIYELDADPNTVLGRLASHTTPPPAALDAAGARIYFWEPIGSTAPDQ